MLAGARQAQPKALPVVVQALARAQLQAPRALFLGLRVALKALSGSRAGLGFARVLAKALSGSWAAPLGLGPVLAKALAGAR